MASFWHLVCLWSANAHTLLSLKLITVINFEDKQRIGGLLAHITN